METEAEPIDPVYKAPAAANALAGDSPIFQLTVNDLQQRPVPLVTFVNQVLLVVNVASRCVYTAQYSELEEAYRKFKDQGFTVLAFPCDQFLRQEFSKPEQIAEFCSTIYGASFPIFEKLKVNGLHTHPLFHWLKASAPGWLGTQTIKWNFTKFLIDRKGQVVKRYGPNVSPKAITAEIERLLAE